MNNLNSKSDNNIFQDTLTKYKKYWKWYVISVVIFGVLGVFYLKIKDPIFSINANVLIKTDDESSKSGGMATSSLMKSIGGIGGMMASENITDEIEIMSSQSLMKQMIYNLNLYTQYSRVRFPFNKSLYKESPILLEVDKEILDTLTTNIKLKIEANSKNDIDIKVITSRNDEEKLHITKLPSQINTKKGKIRLYQSQTSTITSPYKLEVIVSGLDEAAENFKEIVNIAQVNKRSNVINLNIEDNNKSRGKDILNEIIQLYNIDALSDKNKTALSSQKFLKARTDTIYADLRSVEEKIEKYKIKNNLTDTQAEAAIALSQLTELQKKNIETEVQKSMISSIESFLKSSSNKNQLAPQSLVLNSEANRALDQYNALLLQKQQLLRNSNEQNPVIQSLNERITTMREQVLSTLNSTKKDINTAQRDWQVRENEMSGRKSQIPHLEREYVDVKRQQEIKSEIYLFLLQKMEETQLTLASSAPKAKIVDKAFSLNKPVSPKKKIVLVGFVLFGLMLSVLIIYIKEKLKTTINTKEELEEIAQIEIAGEIAKGNPSVKIVVQNNSTEPSVELFRLLRGNLMFLLNNPEQKVILVTSTLPQEGKTYISSNLAASLALTEKRVILVGLDIRSPKIDESFNLKQGKGITNYLSDNSLNIDNIIQPSNFNPHLDIALAGPIPPNPNELLLKDRLQLLFSELKKRYDYIIVDSAPVGVVSDTFLLNKISDVCLYVTYMGKTRKESITFANSLIANGKLNNIYFVANGIDLKEKNGGYGYGYGRSKK